MWVHLRNAGQLLREALAEWTGEAAYRRYLQRCETERLIPLDRGRYDARRAAARYRGASRCC